MAINTVPQRPYSPDLAPCDFCLFSKLRGCRYETTEEMKEAVTKVIDMLTQEDFHGAFQKLLERYKQMHCSWRRLLRRGLEFHVCTINKSAHTKMSGNLSNDPRNYSPSKISSTTCPLYLINWAFIFCTENILVASVAFWPSSKRVKQELRN